MVVHAIEALSSLYERDETAWLDAMSALARDGRASDLDLPHLAEFLADMAIRERREVKSRLTVLLAHRLKWQFQPERRCRSWTATIVEQRQELATLIGRGVLRNHAEDVLSSAYLDAIERASAETGMSQATFPGDCPWDLDGLLMPGSGLGDEC